MNQLINSFYPAVNNINQQFLKEYEYWGSRQEKKTIKINSDIGKKKEERVWEKDKFGFWNKKYKFVKEGRAGGS